MSDVTLQDELEVVSDAFEEAMALVGLDLAVIHDPSVDVLRGIVIFLSQQLRRQVLAIDSDDVMCIAHDAQMLFDVVCPMA